MAAPIKAVGPKSDKLWRDAVMRAVKRRVKVKDVADSPQRLEIIADKVAQMAMDGDMQAVKEIGDRIDGRSVQPIAGADGESDLKLVIEVVKFAENPDPE